MSKSIRDDSILQKEHKRQKACSDPKLKISKIKNEFIIISGVVEGWRSTKEVIGKLAEVGSNVKLTV